MQFTVRGLIIRETAVKDNDKFLTVLSADRGKISIYAHGVHGIKSPYVNICTLLCYDEFTVEERRGKLTMKEACAVESFREVRNNLEKFALAQYFCEVCGEIAVEGEDCSELLALVLNSLYVLSFQDKPLMQVKGVFELRCALIAGVVPNLTECAECGCENAELMYLDVMNGIIRCGECMASLPIESLYYENGRPFLQICIAPPVLAAMRYVVSADEKRLAAFTLASDILWKNFSEICETYLINQFERSFATLDFFKSLITF